jgi:hypothetical protein
LGSAILKTHKICNTEIPKVLRHDGDIEWQACWRIVWYWQTLPTQLNRVKQLIDYVVLADLADPAK